MNVEWDFAVISSGNVTRTNFRTSDIPLEFSWIRQCIKSSTYYTALYIFETSALHTAETKEVFYQS